MILLHRDRARLLNWAHHTHGRSSSGRTNQLLDYRAGRIRVSGHWLNGRTYIHRRDAPLINGFLVIALNLLLLIFAGAVRTLTILEAIQLIPMAPALPILLISTLPPRWKVLRTDVASAIDIILVVGDFMLSDTLSKAEA